MIYATSRCSLWSKVTKLKANHNARFKNSMRSCAVPYGAKLLNWKQITTHLLRLYFLECCSLWSKVTKLKANHNIPVNHCFSFFAVPYGAKLLNWKQITTWWCLFWYLLCCSLWSKVTKLKANHNIIFTYPPEFEAVPYGAKLLNWKQITTGFGISFADITLFLMEQSY